MRLKEKSAIVVISLAVNGNFGAIYPKEIAEKFPPENKITEYIGTGPFKLAEWKPDQYIRMVRFDDYKPRPEKPNGYGGAKIPYVDEIRYGDLFGLRAIRGTVKGFNEKIERIRLYNVWLDK